MSNFVNGWSLTGCVALVGVGLAAVAGTGREHHAKSPMVVMTAGCPDTTTRFEVGYGVQSVPNAACARPEGIAESQTAAIRP